MQQEREGKRKSEEEKVVYKHPRTKPALQHHDLECQRTFNSFTTRVLLLKSKEKDIGNVQLTSDLLCCVDHSAL